MKELSLHVLDLGINSIDAEANKIAIIINEDTKNDILSVEIDDDGRGMDEYTVNNAVNPFVTTRKTRKVGLGIPLTEQAAKQCGGDFNIESVKGKGTRIKFSFKYFHIDREPLGNMGQTIMTLINTNKDVDIYYKHIYDKNEFIFDTIQIKKILGSVDINSPDILLWIRDYINDNIAEIKKKMY